MPAKPHNLNLGKKGEKIAAAFLEEAGYKILQANYRAGRGEIDLIVQNNDLLVFVEVKARTSVNFGFPEEAVTKKKAEKLIETATVYLEERSWDGPIRFDIVSVDLSKKGEVMHFEDAFY